MIRFYGKYGDKVDCLLGAITKWTEVSFWRYIWLWWGDYCRKIEWTWKRRKQ